MKPRIRIGNQTAISCADPFEPFRFALEAGFDAFEWFADKRVAEDGSTQGWDEPDMDDALRAAIREAGADHDVRFTVHAPWQANPLEPEGNPLLLRSIDFARAIGADLVNLHLYLDEGAAGYVQALLPVLGRAADVGIRLSIENTTVTTPADVNELFACLHAARTTRPGAVGMCLDIGHANLCPVTHNDYVRFLDELSLEVPVIHVHLHENHGDADRHLTLFTGPARDDDTGVRGLLKRLCRRDYGGVMILEQWPTPPQLLTEAATRLRTLLDAPECE